MDHFLAMVCVGIVSAQIGGRAIWTVPATFVLIMAFGGFLGWLDIGLTALEAGIAFSVLALGTAIAADKTVPLVVAMSAVGVFAIFHGYAHGAEMPAVAQPITYALGFMTGTSLLHVLGVVIGDISQHYARGKVILRVSGAAIAAVGGLFLYGAA
jgi:urease accessory protein